MDKKEANTKSYKFFIIKHDIHQNMNNSFLRLWIMSYHCHFLYIFQCFPFCFVFYKGEEKKRSSKLKPKGPWLVYGWWKVALCLTVFFTVGMRALYLPSEEKMGPTTPELLGWEADGGKLCTGTIFTVSVYLQNACGCTFHSILYNEVLVLI